MPEDRCDRGNLSRMVRLDVADRDQRIAALRHRIRGEPFELADLVAAEGEARGDVVALGPDLDAKLLGQPRQRMDRRRPEAELASREALLEVEGHGYRFALLRAVMEAQEADRVKHPAPGPGSERVPVTSSSGRWTLRQSRRRPWRNPRPPACAGARPPPVGGSLSSTRTHLCRRHNSCEPWLPPSEEWLSDHDCSGRPTFYRMPW